ncbi:7383_t:CDS:2, partial [Scutellospora calospora]
SELLNSNNEHNNINESNTLSKHIIDNLTEDNIQQYKDRSPYKAESIVSAYTSLCCYLFEVSTIKNSGLKGQNKYRKFTSHCIYISADLPNSEFKPIQDILNYINLYSSNTYEYFYLQLTRTAQKINNRDWFSITRLEKNTLGSMMKEIAYASDIDINDQKITNHSDKRTAIQLLSNLNVNKYEIMQFLDYHSVNRLRSYKVPNNDQLLKNSALLISTIQESHINEQEVFQVMQQDSQYIQENSQQTIPKKRKLGNANEEIKLMLNKLFCVLFQKLQDQTQNISVTKDRTTNIFEFHNSGNI